MTSVPFAPMRDWVLVRRIEAGVDKTLGGLYIPDNYQRKSRYAEVLAVGPGYPTKHGGRVPCAVSVGELVVVPLFAGEPVELAGVEGPLQLVRDIEFLGVLEDEE